MGGPKGLWARETYTSLLGYRDWLNMGLDVTSLISAFAFSRFVETMISKFATSEISIFVASLSSWGDWYKSLFIGTPKRDFVSTRPICFRESEQQGCWCDCADA